MKTLYAAACLLLSSLANAQELTNPGNFVSVTGDAEIKVIPNQVVISLAVETREIGVWMPRVLKTTRTSRGFWLRFTASKSIRLTSRPISFRSTSDTATQPKPLWITMSSRKPWLSL
jgi:hypothetical protein